MSSSIAFSEFQALARKRLMQMPNNNQRLPRSQILNLSVLVGELSAAFLKDAPLDNAKTPRREALSEMTSNNDSLLNDEEKSSQAPWATASIQEAMGALLWSLFLTSESCGLDLRVCIVKKMKLNARKYPTEASKGRAGKYTDYSQQTGITKDEGQSTIDYNVDDDLAKLISVAEIQREVRNFAMQRAWSPFHTPRNLLLALIGELGELSELFQWQGDGNASAVETDTEFLDKAGQELADVSIYCLRLADVCQVDISKAAMAKTTCS